MFGWLKRGATLGAQKACRLNIKMDTKKLVSVANRADANLRASGGRLNEGDRRAVSGAQKSLLGDIILGYSNGLTLEHITFALIDPALAELHVTPGAKLAVEHVVKSAVETWREEHPSEANEVIAATSTTFLQGHVMIETFDYRATCFRLTENGALVAVLNDTHVRFLDDVMKTASVRSFEIIAPMTAVELLEGEIPRSYLHEYSLQHYVDLRKRYTGA